MNGPTGCEAKYQYLRIKVNPRIDDFLENHVMLFGSEFKHSETYRILFTRNIHHRPMIVKLCFSLALQRSIDFFNVAPY